ncbi:hypothetical protein HYH02_006496 [Chlamydomonas schloesseri]|uniref:BTB domain-containing protein n=1 Tax=Chlamydomonas schloesseri TaxID=2026947 RepID=A0A835WK87_9CHLO|nr:hypothetical protein HYH02_006496 [Chlamydomonas schloesseri]|eukprot:KAG2448606.1 hypothetical protein HYH02_006496 [Chlamydomonas schloesseri]
MSSALQERLKGLFGTSTLADAEVLFVLETAADGSKRLTIGEKLPAHQFVLRLSSTFIAASLDRHNDMQRNGAADGLPGLRVRMRSADELSAARDALRYCYTGGLSSQTFRDLLLVRRFAVELQISGCEEAADNLMSESSARPRPCSMCPPR